MAVRLRLTDVCGRKGIKLTDKTHHPIVNKQRSRQGDYYYLDMLLHLVTASFFPPRTIATTEHKLDFPI